MLKQKYQFTYEFLSDRFFILGSNLRHHAVVDASHRPSTSRASEDVFDVIQISVTLIS